MSSATVGHVFDACARLELPLSEIESVYSRHLALGCADEKFFMLYLRCRLAISGVKAVALLQDIILDMAQVPTPVAPYIKLFNAALSSSTSAHEAAQVRSSPCCAHPA